jgi:hypothetical protein
MGFAFKGQEIQRDCNKCKRGYNLGTVKKFSQACHMGFCVNRSLYVK